MFENSYKSNWYGMSDAAIIREMGLFIKETRLKKNLSQQDLALKAGVHRITLGDFEQGKRGSLTAFIQLLRALNELELLDVFILKQTISPLQLAKLEAKKRQRASRSVVKSTGANKKVLKSVTNKKKK